VPSGLFKGRTVDMSDGNLSRRKLLVWGTQLGGVLMAVSSAEAAAPKICANVAAMDSGGKSIRESLNYVENFADATMTCGQCAFFTPDGAGCGQCMIFTGIANASGHCESWSKK
jgi:hypothetical protein